MECCTELARALIFSMVRFKMVHDSDKARQDNDEVPDGYAILYERAIFKLTYVHVLKYRTKIERIWLRSADHHPSIPAVAS